MINKVDLISAVRDYSRQRTKTKDKRVDYTVSAPDKDNKILMRAITTSKSKSGYIGVDSVREMVDYLDRNDYDKGIIIGEKFTEAAKKEIRKEKIELVSEAITPNFNVKRLYSTISKYVQNLCIAKCGKFPLNQSDCKGFSDDQYSCDIRLISDNADFHCKKAWINFLERDLVKLLAIEKKSMLVSNLKD